MSSLECTSWASPFIWQLLLPKFIGPRFALMGSAGLDFIIPYSIAFMNNM